MARALIDKYLDDSVPASTQDIWSSVVVPTGEVWHVSRFGGAATGKALIGLQRRIATGPAVWESLRAVAAPGHFEFDINREFTGDGTLRFRILRDEQSASAQLLFAWLEGWKVI